MSEIYKLYHYDLPDVAENIKKTASKLRFFSSRYDVLKSSGFVDVSSLSAPFSHFVWLQCPTSNIREFPI